MDTHASLSITETTLPPSNETAHLYKDIFSISKQLPSEKKLDDFEGEAYKPTAVSVAVSRDGQPDEIVEADMYLWGGEMDCVSSEPWDLEVFIRERLEDWIDLFEGMELVGEGEDSTAHLVT